MAAACRIPVVLKDFRHIFITGGTGRFGVWLLMVIRQLNCIGFSLKVTVLSRNPRNFFIKYPEFVNEAWLYFQEGDVRFCEIPHGVDLVIHAATDTLSSNQGGAFELLDSMYSGSLRVIRQMHHVGCVRGLFVSSGAVYGQLDGVTAIPETCMHAPVLNKSWSSYSEGKRLTELLAHAACSDYGLNISIARCFTFAGPLMPLDAHFAFGNFIRDALFSNEIVITGNGLDVRSYMSYSDMAVWLLSILAIGGKGEVYNVGSDYAISLADLARRITMLVDKTKPVFVRGLVTESAASSCYVPDVSKIKSELGVNFGVGLDELIACTSKYYMLNA